MKIFEHPNLEFFKCPICGTADDKPVVLVAIDGTQKDRISKARQYHVDCIDLVEMKFGMDGFHDTPPAKMFLTMQFFERD